MEDGPKGIRTAERIAGVIAVIAALIVLNGAWVNQHNWQNVPWRIAVAGLLVALAVLVETNAFGLLHPGRTRGADTPVPDFLRLTPDTEERAVPSEAAEASSVQVTTAKRS